MPKNFSPNGSSSLLQRLKNAANRLTEDRVLAMAKGKKTYTIEAIASIQTNYET